MEKLFYLFLVALLCTTCPVNGQVVKKKELTPTDYSLWSKTDIAQVSDKGEWVSYNAQYQNGNDTLFVRNYTASKTFAYPKGFDGKFIRDDYFVCRLQDGLLRVTNLKKGQITQYTDVRQYALSGVGDYIISISGDSLLILGLKNGHKLNHEKVKSFSLSPKRDLLCYTAPEGVFSIDFGKGLLQQRKIYDCSASAFSWQPNGESFAFISTCETGSTSSVSLYNLKKNTLKHLDVDTLNGIGTIAPRPIRFRVSDDGQRVFYSLLGDGSPITPEHVEIWNTSDPITFSESASKGIATTAIESVAVWWHEKKSSIRLTDNTRTSIFLTGDQQYAITYDPIGNTPNFDYYPITDYYITDLKTQKKKLLLKGHTLNPADITASPAGKYIAYRKDKAWWLYSIQSGKHRQLSGISDQFDAAIVGNSLWDDPAIAGWSEGDSKMYFFDDFDLWVIDTENLNFKRLTHGREKGIRFRPANTEIGMQRMNFDGFTLPEIKGTALIRLASTDLKNKRTGFYSIGKETRKLIEADKSLTQLACSKDNASSYYVEQAYEAAPSIKYLGHNGKSRLVYQSNPQHNDFYWGRVELITYRNPENKELQGLLYYPANYNPEKKYPMIVYVYEEMSNTLHSYINPDKGGYTGFNVTNLLSQGYFVLRPDISYKIGDVGVSAADCIISATQSIIDRGIITVDRIALFGHSFGGYEAAFTATQTDMFATIVAGAAFTDLQSAYLDIGENMGQSHIWRFEHQQWRMGKSIFEIPEDYRRNSTVEHAERISSPMLLFSGKKDGQVDFRQSRELYHALRRLEKPAIMLLYPQEGHVLMKEQNQIDFNEKFEQWLAYFLKGTPPPAWMKKEFK